MKTCGKCSESKSVEAFNFQNRATGKRASYCKSCATAYQKQYYLDNKAYHVARAVRNNANSKRRAFEFMHEYLLEHSCVDCGEADPIVLEFDHVRGEKDRAIGTMVGLGLSVTVIRAEIEKCDVRCANCHRRRTARQFGWRKLARIQPP